MTLASRLATAAGTGVSPARRLSAAGSTSPDRTRRIYRCELCTFTDPDPSVTFGHMQRRECKATGARWMRRLADHPTHEPRRD